NKMASSLYSMSSLNFTDENFSQFKALKEAIGNKRIVLLGEQTHGDGTTFEAKALLSKFLHEEMGFNIIAFESGFYEGVKANEQLRNEEKYESAIPKGIAERWSEVEQTQPLFNYVQETISSETPLKIAGFDLLFNEKYATETLLEDFEEFLGNNANLVHPSLVLFKEEVSKILNDRGYFPEKQQRDKIYESIDNTIRILEQERTTHQWNTPSFWSQVWRNFKVDLKNNWSRKDGSYLREVYFSRRDSMMASNIHWLTEENPKIIVWSSVTHNMKDFDHNLLQQMNWSRNTNFMGEYLEGLVGEEQMFHLAFTGYSGFYSDISQNYQRIQFDRPSDNSLEAVLKQVGTPICYLLLDDSWTDTYFKASFIFNKEYQSNWSRSIDAVFFTRAMQPSKPMKKL
uniref:erythromycin esterase family protein n=1 Tax=Fulvivirga sp. TaxID=1931237 RepID=UPI00404B08FF